MRTIQVIAPGLCTTVQDMGREGFGPLGISVSGAADSIALRLGNRLAENIEGAAALEMTLLGGKFLFPEGAVIALAGSDFGATLNNAPVPLWASLKVTSGQILKLGSTQAGARCYLCVRGGVVVPHFLGSASTHILSGLGGFEGRALRKGDSLQIGDAEDFFRQRKIAPQALPQLLPKKTLRVTPGPQSDWFSCEAHRLFHSSQYRVSEKSNRMGLRLEGSAVALARISGAMITEGVALGAIQIPEGGQPIILFVELQTTGGYPKIANVISADLPSVGQLRPRDEVDFKPVSWADASLALREQEALLASDTLILD